MTPLCQTRSLVRPFIGPPFLDDDVYHNLQSDSFDKIEDILNLVPSDQKRKIQSTIEIRPSSYNFQ